MLIGQKKKKSKVRSIKGFKKLYQNKQKEPLNLIIFISFHSLKHFFLAHMFSINNDKLKIVVDRKLMVTEYADKGHHFTIFAF